LLELAELPPKWDAECWCWNAKNTHLTKSGQKTDFWTFWLVLAGRDEGIRRSRRAAKFLKIEKILLKFLNKNMKNPKSLKIEYILAAYQD
jgi:hypothetical protein